MGRILGSGWRESGRIERARGWGVLLNDPDVDDHIVTEVFVPRDECVVPIILETDACDAMVQSIEVLDSRNY